MKKVLLLIFLLNMTCLSASCPQMHFCLAERFLLTYPQFDVKKFMLGTMFPDIYKIADIPRDRTHYEEMTLEEVLQESSPFVAGAKFHSYVDIERERIAQEYGIYDFLKNLGLPYDTTFVKLLEDQVIEKPWCIDYLRIPVDEELWVGLDNVQKWHTYLISYLKGSPVDFLWEQRRKGRPFFNHSDQEIERWCLVLGPLAANSYVQDYVRVLVDHFPGVE